jgi:uncharacterized protein
MTPMANIPILFYFGHPAQFLFARQAMRNLRDKGVEVHVLIKTKDVLEDLLKAEGLAYTNILPEGRSSSRLGMVVGLLKRDWAVLRYCRKHRIGMCVGTDPSLAHVSFLLRIPVITTVEDDIEVIPRLAKTTYPFTSYIFAPRVCRVGDRYEHKKIAYDGYMKLAYLHPKYFVTDETILRDLTKPYILVRLAGLTAHHDENIRGIERSLLDQILQLAGDQYTVLISSEYALPVDLEAYRLRISPERIHHVIFHAEMLVCDSQSMTVEAAILGTPSIRYSDFAGRISVLEELEHRYGLTIGVKPPHAGRVIEELQKALSDPGNKEEHRRRRERMLTEKIDVTELLTETVVGIMARNAINNNQYQ